MAIKQPSTPLPVTIYLGLGSNMGDRQEQLREALRLIGAVVKVQAIASLYETEPVGYLEQPRFLNSVCSARTTLSAPDLLKVCKQIETRMGRTTAFRNAPRPIDIDLLLYADLRLADDTLTIPHPRMHERAFVLVPLAEIAPDVIEPVSGQPIQALLQQIPQQGIGLFAARGWQQST